MDFYKNLLNSLEEAADPACVIIANFNICKREDPEEHVHLEWAMKFDEENELVFDRPEIAKEALTYLTGPRAKYSDFLLRQIFTDEKVNVHKPAFDKNMQLDFDNFYHFITKLDYSKDYSDKYFVVFAPVSAEVLLKDNNPRSNEVFDEALHNVITKKKDLKLELASWDKEPGSINLNVPINDLEQERLEELGVKVNRLTTDEGIEEVSSTINIAKDETPVIDFSQRLTLPGQEDEPQEIDNLKNLETKLFGDIL